MWEIKMNVYKKTNDWYIEWQQVLQGLTTNGTMSDNEWQQMATSDKA